MPFNASVCFSFKLVGDSVGKEDTNKTKQKTSTTTVNTPKYVNSNEYW